MQVIQTWLRYRKQATSEENPFFFLSRNTAQEADMSPNAEEKLYGKSASKWESRRENGPIF